ncbi:MAG: rod shape-determining protein [Ruminococcus sp.]
MNIAIDIGTCNTRIATQSDGIIIDEPSVITYDTYTNSIIAVGEGAYKTLGKTPKRVQATFPMADGAISASELVENMVRIFIGKIGKKKISMPRVITAVPGGITEVEKRAIVNAISSYGVRTVYLIESAKAAALGAGLDILSGEGQLVADLGGGTSDIAVLSLGGVSSGISLRKAGNEMDKNIIKYMKNKYKLSIGLQMAELCKKEIGFVKMVGEDKTFVMKGVDLTKGLPKAIEVKKSELVPIYQNTMLEIIRGIVDVLENTPPELNGDLLNNGIVFTGGLSKIGGLRELVSDYIRNLKITIAEEPDTCVIRGITEAIQYIKKVENKKGHEINPLLAAY